MEELLSGGLFQKVVEYAPAVFILIVVSWNQQRMINKIMDTCLAHLAAENEERRKG